MLNMWSAASNYLAFVVSATKYADLLPGLSYGVTLINTTAADVASGTITLEAADALPDDACKPGTFAALAGVPQCDAAPGTVAGPATIQLTPQNPIRAYSQCTYAFACPNQFLRVTGVPASLDAVVVVTRLRRTDFSIGNNTGGIESFRAA